MSSPSTVTAVLGAVAMTGSLLIGASAPAGAATTAPAHPARTAATCADAPVFAGSTPSPSASIGFELGSRKASVAQLYRYMSQVDRASAKVTVSTYGKTAQGTPLKYALIGRPEVVKAAQAGKVAADIKTLRDPATTPERARAIAERSPSILWLVGSIHGNEPTSLDAQMRVLYELADRTDCGVTDILDNALIVLVPTQNPDGHDADTRVNAAGFDMNRDWFAATQPETRARRALLDVFPPQVFIDQHGMGGTGYYFPPNSDPIHHEAPRQAIGWINDIAGKGAQDAFAKKGYAYETWQAGFDLLYPGYGDSFPTFRNGAAGITHEVGQAAPYPDQVDKHYTAAMASLQATARARVRINTEYHQQAVEAKAQGQACRLQENRVYNPGSTVQIQVPDRAVCGYFIRTDDPARKREVASMISRLQQDGVEVRRLTAPAHVADFKAYGQAPRATTMPAGTYWISMAQAQKHWIQIMLGEDSYVPFAYFYDVSAWSQPLLADVAGGSTGTMPAMRTTKVGKVTVPNAPRPAGLPRVGVLTHSPNAYSPNQSTAWIQWRLKSDWKIPATTFQAGQLDKAALDKLDVLLVPSVDANGLHTALGATRNGDIAQWVRDGGRLVTWQGGTQYAALAGLSSAVLKEPKTEVPGALIRVEARRNGPLTNGMGRDAWAMYNADPIMTAGAGEVVLSYPKADSATWATSGYAKGSEELGGSAALIDEQVGQGRVTVFSFEPNFRAFSDGTATLVRNAIIDSRGTLTRSIERPRAATEAQRQVAGKAARKLPAAVRDVRTDERAQVASARP